MYAAVGRGLVEEQRALFQPATQCATLSWWRILVSFGELFTLYPDQAEVCSYCLDVLTYLKGEGAVKVTPL